MIMSMRPYNLQPSKSAINFRTVPGLAHICKLSGNDSAIPRVLHKHSNRVEVAFIVRGGGHYLVGDHFYNANQGDILIFNNNVVHDEKTSTSENALIFSLGIDPQMWARTLEKYNVAVDSPTYIRSGDNYDLLLEYFNLLWSSESLNYIESQEAFTELLELIALAVRKAERDISVSDENAIGKKILNYIEENFLDEISLEVIADELEINRFYLIHAFKNFSGYSPKQYIIRRRIGEAQSLLCSSQKTITEIANSVGYFNISNFNRIFKQVTGMAPGNYQRYLKRCVISRGGLL